MIGRTNADGGGGLDTDVLTAAAGDVIKGKTAGVKGSDDPVTGTLELTGTAADANVLSGKTYYNTDAKARRTGTMANNGTVSGTLNCGQSKSIPAGYTTGGTVTANSLSSQTSATAAASQILSGKTAWVNGNKITGNMANRGGYGGVGNSRGNDAGNKRMWVRVPGGYYNENANVYLNWSDIASMAGLTADKLKKGVSALGIIGSWEGYTSSPLYLFNNGKWSNLQTSGFTAYGSDNRTAIVDGMIKLKGRSGTGWQYDWIRLNQTIDLTNYNYLKVTVSSLSSNTYVDIGVSSNSSSGPSSSTTAAHGSLSTTGTCICNVSNITGSYYILIGGKYSSSSVVSISQIFLSNS